MIQVVQYSSLYVGALQLRLPGCRLVCRHIAPTHEIFGLD
jgi:hypothetical protein